MTKYASNVPLTDDGQSLVVGGAGAGWHGSDRITGTTATNAPAGFVWRFIQVVGTANAVFTSLTGNMTNSAGLTLVPGSVVAGTFTALQLSAGAVVAYREPL